MISFSIGAVFLSGESGVALVVSQSLGLGTQTFDIHSIKSDGTFANILVVSLYIPLAGLSLVETG